MFTCKVNLLNFEKAIRKYSEFKVSRNNDVLSKVGNELKQVSRKCFMTERSPDGRKWQPLSKSTLSIRKSKGKILNINGKLRNSVTYRVKNDSVIAYTPLKYGKLHQVGNKEKNLPARPFIGISREARVRIKNILAKEISK